MKIIAILLFLLSLSTLSLATERVALVIANDKYQDAPSLERVNDSRTLVSTLKGMGFRVTSTFNANHNAMAISLNEFIKSSHSAEIALVFYAGHSLHNEGENYLVPIDYSAKSSRENLVSLSHILQQVSQARAFSVVVLDTAPLGSIQFTGIDQSLLLAISNRENELNGASVYIRSLIKHLSQKKDIRQVLTTVQKEVVRRTNGTQQPYLYENLGGGKYCLSCTVAITPIAPPKAEPDEGKQENPQSALSIVDIEREKLQLADIEFIVPTNIDMTDTAEIKLLIKMKPTSSDSVGLKKGMMRYKTEHRVSDRVKAHLTNADKDLVIERITEETLAVSSTGVTEWKWSIKPTKPGPHKISLAISPLSSIRGDSTPLYSYSLENKVIQVNESWMHGGLRILKEYNIIEWGTVVAFLGFLWNIFYRIQGRLSKRRCKSKKERDDADT